MPARQLSLTQAVLAYRAEYLVEHGFGHLKGKPLTLPPISGLGRPGHGPERPDSDFALSIETDD